MRVFVIALLGVFLTACGGNGDSGPETGTVTFAITDASIDDYQEALFEVSSITLIGAGGQETNVLDTPQTIDLLKLRNVSELLLRETLTARTISKIRLGVDGITLNKLDMDGNITDSVSPPVPTRKIDLNLQGPLEVRAGEDVLVVIDVDMYNSVVKLTETGNGTVRFRPVVKVSGEVSGLVRLYGTYTVDGTDVSVCDLERVSDADGVYDVLDICVALDESGAAYFGSDGTPLVAGDPQNSGDLASGEKVSVYGYYQPSAAGDVLAAELVVRGTGTRGQAFTTLNGIAMTNWDSTSRRYDLALTDTDTIPVELSEGAKVFDLDGVLVDPATSIVVGQRTEARGALTDSMSADPDWLQSFVVFVAGTDSNDTTAGNVTAIDGNKLMLDAPSCVVTDADTEFFSIAMGGDITDTSEITLADIAVGNSIEASGDQVGDCIQAETVIREM